NDPLAIVSSTPANNAKGAGIFLPISLFVNKKLDAATVNATTVKLRWSTGYGWHQTYGTVSYDEATLKISFVPAQPLYTRRSFEVVVDGVKSANGSETLSNAKVKFTSPVNYFKRSTSFQTNSLKVSSWSEQVLDMNGHSTQGINHRFP